MHSVQSHHMEKTRAAMKCYGGNSVVHTATVLHLCWVEVAWRAEAALYRLRLCLCDQRFPSELSFLKSLQPVSVSVIAE